MSDVAKYHNSQFDPILQEAHDFVSHDLGLQVAPRENIALITPEQAIPFWAYHGETEGGGYDPKNNTAVVVQSFNPAGLHTTNVQNKAAVAHEISHTGVAKEDEHTFYNEALPGIVEYKLLEKLARHGEYRPAVDFILQRAGVRLWVPNNMRYLDAREATEASNTGSVGAHSSQGMLAALGLAHTFSKSGLKSTDLLAMSRQNGRAQFAAMKYSLNALKPGLAAEVESMPETTDGIIQASASIEAEARKQGLL